MKKFLKTALALALSATVAGALVGCFGQKDKKAEEEAMDKAINFVYNLYAADLNRTGADFEVIGSTVYGETEYAIEWTVNVTEGVRVVVGEDGTVTIDVDETTANPIEYTLTATIKSKNFTKSCSFDLVVPAYVKPYTVSQAIALAAGLDTGATDYYKGEDGSAAKIYVTGKVVAAGQNKTTYIQNSYIKDEETGETLMIYSANLPAGETELHVDDTVTVYGYLQQYYNTLEITSNSARTDYPIFITIAHNHGEIEAPVEADRTLSFADVTNRIYLDNEQQVWEGDNIRFTNVKAASSSAVANYSNPVRLYRGSNITVESAGILKAVFTCNSYDYAKELLATLEAGSYTAAQSGETVTVTFENAVSSFTIENLVNQVRLDKLGLFVDPDAEIIPPAHLCTSKCPICGKCTNADCTEEACADKCEGHESVVLPEGGTLEDPYTVSEALEVAATLGSSKSDKVYVKGTLTDLGTDLSRNGKTGRQNSVITDESGATITTYRCYYNETVTSVAVGDVVVISGYLQVYNGKAQITYLDNDHDAEFVSKEAAAPVEHVCESVCPTCGKCTNATCTEAACADKCEGHGDVVEPETKNVTYDFSADGSTNKGLKLDGKDADALALFKNAGAGDELLAVSGTNLYDGNATGGGDYENSVDIIKLGTGSKDGQVKLTFNQSVTKIVLVVAGWKNTDTLAVNGSAAQTLAALTANELTFVLATPANEVTIAAHYRALIEKITVYIDINSEVVGLPHACESKCPTCGKCTNADCTEAACADKCEGHESVVLPEGGTLEDPYTVSEALEVAATLGSSKSDKVYVKGTLTDLGTDLSRNGKTGRQNSVITDESGATITTYRCYYNETVTSVAVGDVVVISGYLQVYNGKAQITYLDNDHDAEFVSKEAAAPVEHVCESVCPTCGKCTNATCTEAACADKCEGHEVVVEHVCESVCPTCGKCTNADCTEEACADKCEGHGDVEEPVVVEHTLSFADEAKRTSQDATQQVWEDDGITLTNDKAASTSNVIASANPVRFYANSSITIEASGIVKIVFNCNAANYATALFNSLTASGYTATADGKVVTVTFEKAVDTVTIAKLTAQIRMDSMVVYCEENA